MSKKIKITLSDRRPVTIVEADWPIIAEAEQYPGQYSFQAFDGAFLKVREHADGRRIVYGYDGDGDGGGRPTAKDVWAGYLVPADADENETIRAIRRVAGVLAANGRAADDSIGDAVIAALPTVELA